MFKMVYRHIGFIHGRDVWKWDGFYYVNPIPNVGGVMRNDSRFRTLREILNARTLLESIARIQYGF
jgi:hypothetical protein